MQVYRALLPPLSQEACAQLLQRLHICLADFGTNNQIAAIDVLLTLTVSCAHCLLPARLSMQPLPNDYCLCCANTFLGRHITDIKRSS